MRGMASMLIHYIDKYGAQPYDSYEDQKDINYKTLCRKVEQLCDGAICPEVGVSRKLKDELNNLFRSGDRLYACQAGITCSVPNIPRWSLPTAYATRKSMYRSPASPIIPYREYFALEVPDNQLHDQFLNLPLDELMLHIQKAIENGHPVCWEGDISEEGFIHAQGQLCGYHSARTPRNPGLPARESFEQLRTTDDHVMEIIGTFLKDKQRYYVCRNSAGHQLGQPGPHLSL